MQRDNWNRNVQYRQYPALPFIVFIAIEEPHEVKRGEICVDKKADKLNANKNRNE